MNEERDERNPSRTPTQHRAPATDTRPRSRAALPSFLLAIALSGLAFVLDFAWPLILVAFVVATIAALRVDARTHRGRGWILLALVVSILAGGLALLSTVSFRDMASHMTHGVLTSAASEGTPEELEERVAKWFVADAIETGAPADVLRRYRELVAEVGPYAGEVHLPSIWLGLRGVLERRLPGPDENLGALWAEAEFRDRRIRVQLVLSSLPVGETRGAVEKFQKRHAVPLLVDVRFHRDR